MARSSLDIDELAGVELGQTTSSNHHQEMAEHFSPEEIEECKECFSLYDRDGDGLISIEQLKLVMRSLAQCPTQNDINTISKKLGKAKISFPEFLEILLVQKRKTVQDWKNEIFDAFKAYDTNGLGYVTLKDLQHIVMQTGEKLMQQEFDYMLYQAGISKNTPHIYYKDLAKAFSHL
eukprot:gene10773-11926_t